MNCINTFMIVFCFLSHHNAFEFEKDKELIQLIEDRTIFFDGKIGSLKLFLNENSSVPDMGKFVSKHPNMAFTALKCKYADYIVDLLQSFCCVLKYGIIKSDFNSNPVPIKNSPTAVWLSTAITELLNTKKLVEKIMFNLFYYSDKIPELRDSDQNLLKSLVAFNLFLYYGKDAQFITYCSIANISNTDVFLHILLKSIMQAINKIEQFRWKNCAVHDLYASANKTVIDLDDDENFIKNLENIKKILSPALDNINKLIDAQTVIGPKFSEKMYDPEFLLLAGFLEPGISSLGDVWVIGENGVRSNLKQMYESLKQKHNLKDVLHFQNTLISIVADLFFREVCNSLTDSTKQLSDLKKTMSSFKAFLNRVMPNHRLVDALGEILKALSSLNEVLQDEHEAATDKQRLSSVAAQFKNLINDGFVYETNQNVKDLSLSTLMTTIADSRSCESFNQVVSLLSRDPHANDDFYIEETLDYERKLDVDGDLDFLSTVEDLRFYLFAFMVLQETAVINNRVPTRVVHRTTPSSAAELENQKDHNDDLLDVSKVGDVFERRPMSNIVIITNVVYEYFELFEKNTEIKYILLPLLIRFQRSIRLSNESDPYDASVLYQISFVTVNLLEHYLLRKYTIPTYNWDIFNFRVLNKHRIPNLSDLKQIIEYKAESSTVRCNMDDLNNIYDRNTHEKFFLDSDRSIVFYRSGKTQNCFQILSDLSQGIIDLDDLIRYQWFTIKFFTAKMLVKINIVIELSHSQYGNQCQSMNESFDFLQNHLKTFWNYTFIPKRVRHILDRAITTVSNILTNSANFEPGEKSHRDITKNLELLDVHSVFVPRETSDRPDDIQRAIEELKEDIVLFDKLLKEYSVESQRVFFFDDFIFFQF